MSIVLIIAGCLCMAATLVLLLRPWCVPAAITAWLGVLALHASYAIDVKPVYLAFWGVAAAIVGGIAWLSPKGEPDGRRISNLYLSLGALAGCLLGVLFDTLSSPRFMTLGAILGTLVGQLAYSRTRAGQWMRSSGAVFWRYTCAKGLPVMVAVSIIGLAVEGLAL